MSLLLKPVEILGVGRFSTPPYLSKYNRKRKKHLKSRLSFFSLSLPFTKTPVLGRFRGFSREIKNFFQGSGRRDFELGSAPVFPVVRVEIDLGRMAHTYTHAHTHTYAYTHGRIQLRSLSPCTLSKKKTHLEKKFLNVLDICVCPVTDHCRAGREGWDHVCVGAVLGFGGVWILVHM